MNWQTKKKAEEIQKMLSEGCDLKEILQVKDLAVAFQTYRGKVKAVRNVSFDLKRGQALGIVGESGCGKSVTAHAIMGLLPKKNSIIEKEIS